MPKYIYAAHEKILPCMITNNALHECKNNVEALSMAFGENFTTIISLDVESECYSLFATFVIPNVSQTLD